MGAYKGLNVLAEYRPFDGAQLLNVKETSRSFPSPKVASSQWLIRTKIQGLRHEIGRCIVKGALESSSHVVELAIR